MCDFVKVFSGSFKQGSLCLAHILHFAMFACDAVYDIGAFTTYVVFAYVGSVGDFAGNSTSFVKVFPKLQFSFSHVFFVKGKVGGVFSSMMAGNLALTNRSLRFLFLL